MAATKKKHIINKVDLFPDLEDYGGKPYLFQITGPRGGMRCYQRPGSLSPLWSVTTILGQIVAKPALMNWYNKMGREAVAEHLTSVVGQTLTPEILELALREAGSRPEKSKQEAASLGIKAHELISTYINKRIEEDSSSYVDVPDDLNSVWDAFMEWERESDIKKYLKTEFACFSTSYKYAGSIDALAQTSSGKFMVIDWKTSKSLYPEHALQVTAYANAMIYPLRQYYGLPETWPAWDYIEPWVIRLGKEDAQFEAKQVTDPLLALNSFLNGIEMWYGLGLPGLTPKSKKDLEDYFELPDNLPSVW